MPRTAHCQRQTGLWLRVGTGALILLFLALTGVAVCPAAHERLHHEAASVDHHCGITLIGSGACEASDANMPRMSFVPLASVAVDPLHPVRLESLFCLCSPLEHAPPALS